VYDALGEMYVAADQAERAVALWDACLATVRERAPEDATLQTRFSIRLATAHAALGAVERQRQAIADATDTARERPIPLSRVRVYWMQGIEAWEDADSEAALTYIRRAIGLLEAQEDTLQIARLHVVAGRMLSLDARPDEAAEHLERAERLFALGSTPVDLGVLRAENARLAAHRGDGDEALLLAHEAAKLLNGHARFRSNVAHAKAAAHAAAGNTTEAEAHYRQALEALTDTDQWREAGQVARELSKLLRAQGRETEAFELLDRAAVLAIRHIGGVQRRTKARTETDQ